MGSGRPPVIVTFPIAPRLAERETVKLLAETFPLVSTTTVVGYSPTEKPATEFKGLIAILYSYVINIYRFGL